MKRILAVAATAGLLTVGLTACGGDSEFCERADEIGGDMSVSGDFGSMIGTFEELRDEAPDDIRGDFDVVIEQFEIINSGDVTDADTEAMTTAADNIQEWGQENC